MDTTDILYDDHRHLRILNDAYLGHARVPLESLYYQNSGGRVFSELNKERLLEIYSNAGCERMTAPHFIMALISPVELDKYLKANSMSRSSLSLGEMPFLRLPSSPTLHALSGRHRWEAAKEFYTTPQDRWWAVVLFNKEMVPPECLVTIAEEYDNSMPYPDGEIYGHVRTYQLLGRRRQAAKWINRISSGSKRRDFWRLLQNPSYRPFCDALDMLCRYPAVLASFSLGNIRRFFRMKCAEELAASIKHIYYAWMEIMGELPGQLLDAGSVNRLQGRSPKWSSSDASYVDSLFASGQLFTNIHDPSQRSWLRDRLFSFNGLIPSIKTFLENTKFLEPAAISLRALLPRRFTGTLRQQMLQHFKASKKEFWPAYQRIWLTALRLFPYLTTFKPLQDKRGYREEYAGDYWCILAKSALEFGFNSPKIGQIAKKLGDSNVSLHIARNPQIFTNEGQRWRLRQRCGMPTESTFNSLSPYLCLENMRCTLHLQPGATDISAFAVAREAFLSFFNEPDQDTHASPETNGQLNATPVGLSPSTQQADDQEILPDAQNPPSTTLTECPPISSQRGDMVLPDALNLTHTVSPEKELSLQLALPVPPFDQSGNLPRDSRAVTPFPTLSTNHELMSSGADLWEASVIKEFEKMRPSEIRNHLKQLSSPYGIYFYDECLLYHFQAEALAHLESFMRDKQAGWWLAKYDGENLITFDPADVKYIIETEHVVVCGKGRSYFEAQRDEEAQLL
ncbi:uncharacterized protein KD926_002082 [Aspergillus affinis]|uniref:uncharacterized protein n=1 Tax=Aspergillus affinis TaxID=1070780 RepID=UPI0022FEE8D2|nr:uncharacterized protein KD926_002082 [Aspergillus affinis]KAI9036318.1 hypothetical protein KD926_002082 [Aspergillus affinis]